MTMELLLWLIPLPPLLAFGLFVLGANRSRGFSHALAVVAAFFHGPAAWRFLNAPR
jgi:NADH-quinone oxidoreductase subunit L